MFGISLTEIAVIATIALVVVGPQKLPGMLRTMGQWVRKLRKLTTEVRAQTGIDEILREEGIDGVRELRSLLRGEIAAARHHQRGRPTNDPYPEVVDFDSGREYPVEGPDAYHAIPDDLVDSGEAPEESAETANAPVDPAAEPLVSPSVHSAAAQVPPESPAAGHDPEPSSFSPTQPDASSASKPT